MAQVVPDASVQRLGPQVVARLPHLALSHLNDDPGAEDTWRYRIDVSVEEFHGTLNGEARLVAYWSLRNLMSGAVIESIHPALVDAQIALLDELAESIVQALRRVGL